jgi:hypothetical protein
MDMSATIVIGRHPDFVYGFVSDPANDVRWRTGVTESGLTSDPPMALGSEGFARAGKSVTRWRVVAFDEGRSIDWELTEGPFGGSGGYRVEGLDGNTRFTLVADVVPGGVMRLLGPLFGVIGRRQNRADVQRLKEILESEDAA